MSSGLLVAIGKVSVSSCALPYATVGQSVTLTANIESGTTTMGPSPSTASSAASARTTRRYLPTLAARVRSHRSGREPARAPKTPSWRHLVKNIDERGRDETSVSLYRCWIVHSFTEKSSSSLSLLFLRAAILSLAEQLLVRPTRKFRYTKKAPGA
jgi:hypothetical protein